MPSPSAEMLSAVALLITAIGGLIYNISLTRRRGADTVEKLDETSRKLDGVSTNLNLIRADVLEIRNEQNRLAEVDEADRTRAERAHRDMWSAINRLRERKHNA